MNDQRYCFPEMVRLCKKRMLRGHFLPIKICNPSGDLSCCRVGIAGAGSGKLLACVG